MVAIAVAVAGAVVASGRAAMPPPVAVELHACGFLTTASAEAVRDQFVATAVLRRRTSCSYELVTEKMRQGLTRTAWRGGSIPVVPFPTAVPRTFAMQVFPKRGGPASGAAHAGSWTTGRRRGRWSPRPRESGYPYCAAMSVATSLAAWRPG
jgi:hypothetical protein